MRASAMAKNEVDYTLFGQHQSEPWQPFSDFLPARHADAGGERVQYRLRQDLRQLAGQPRIWRRTAQRNIRDWRRRPGFDRGRTHGAPFWRRSRTASRASSVASAGSFESDSWALCRTSETEVTDEFSARLAVRYEDYDEFGDTFDWKVSLRYAFTDDFAVRATANTGFRAPTPGQVNTLNVTTTRIGGNLIPNGTYPVDRIRSRWRSARFRSFRGGSESYTAGLVWTPG